MKKIILLISLLVLTLPLHAQESIFMLGASHTQFRDGATGATAKMLFLFDSRLHISPELSYFFKNRECSVLSCAASLGYRFYFFGDRFFIAPFACLEGKIQFNDYDYLGDIVDNSTDTPSSVGRVMMHNDRTEFDLFPHIGLTGMYKLGRRWYILAELKCSSMVFKYDAGELFLTGMAGVGVRL